mgnify:CR=1 FL=1
MSKASAHPSLREAQEQLGLKKLPVEGKGSSSFFLAVLASVEDMIGDVRRPAILDRLVERQVREQLWELLQHELQLGELLRHAQGQELRELLEQLAHV